MKKVIKLNLITLCLINTLSISIVDAKAEETLDQIDVVEKMSITIKTFTEAKAKSTREHIFKDTQTIDQVIRRFREPLLNKIKGSWVR